MRRLLTVLLCCAFVVAGCGDDGTFEGSPGPSSSDDPATTAAPTTAVATTEATTTEATTTTQAPTTTGAPATTATEAPATSTTATEAPSPTARDALAGYFGAVEDLDRRIAEAAVAFNAGWDPDAGTLTDAARDAVLALDARPLRPLIPAGLTPEMEQAVLAVYADLDSRISGMHGGVRFLSTTDDVMICLENGAESFRRFDADFTRMLELADTSPPPIAVAPDSREAGILAVRLDVIRGLNWGCDSCGGFAYDQPIPVDWEGRTTLSGVEFEATFESGRWNILIYAC